MTGKPCNENPCTMAVDNDMKPYVPQRCIFYHGVSREKAITGGDVVISGETVKIEGFRPNEKNKSTTVCCKGDPKEHYSFVDGMAKGLNCMGRLVESEPPALNRIDQVGKVFAIENTITIKLGYNEIFYPRPIDCNWFDEKQSKKNGLPESRRMDYSGLEEGPSKKIYLHELGHLLDTRYIVWSYIRELVNRHNFDVGRVVLKNGLTFTERRELELERTAIPWLEREGEAWLTEVGKLFSNKHKLEIKYLFRSVEREYHQNYGNGGNPWDGIKEAPLLSDETNETSRELAEIIRDKQKTERDIDTEYRKWEEFGMKRHQINWIRVSPKRLDGKK